MKLDMVLDTDDEVGFLYRRFLKRDTNPIDNVIFYLNYHVTCHLYLTACLIITVSMYIMDPIDCISDESVDDIIDNFCFYHSTYTIRNLSAIGDSIKEALIPHPGISSQANQPGDSNSVKYHHYYLWVAPFLAIQAVTFYVPRGLWKSWEAQKVSFILKEKECLTCPESTGRSRRLASYISSKRHKSYFCKLLVCEVFNLVNAIVQLFIMDLFLGLQLFKLNGLFLELIREAKVFQRPEVVDLMFPKVTSCTFLSYGPSGNKVNMDALCVLPVNVINEKVFGVLYIWILAVLIPLSFLAILYRLVVWIFRKQCLKAHLLPEIGIYKEHHLNHLKKKMNSGNWQLLLLAGWNMDSWELTQIVKHLFQIHRLQNVD